MCKHIYMKAKKLEKKKIISETVPVQAIIPRLLYAELVKICAEQDLSIKDAIQTMIEDFVKSDKFLYREWEVSDEDYAKAMTGYEIYETIRDKAEEKGKKK